MMPWSNSDDSTLTSGAALMALYWGRKTLFAAATSGALISSGYFARRSRWAQVRAIKYRMGKWKKNDGRPSSKLKPDVDVGGRRLRLKVSLNREAEMRVLSHQLVYSKPAISFVTGPEGSGKSSSIQVVSATLSSLDYVLHLDLHKEQTGTGIELVENLLRKTGYFFPANAISLQWLIAEQANSKNPSQTKADRKELERGLSFLESALKELAEEHQKFPVIFIDDLHSLKEPALKSAEFRRFLNYCVHLCDEGLCQIVFAGRSYSLDTLDKEFESVRQRRLHFPIDYPDITPELVKVALRHADEGKVFDGEAESRLLVQSFGGQLRDIEKAIDFADNGLSVSATVSKMITESAYFVQMTTVEPILADIAKAESLFEREPYLRQFLRCMKMLEIFSTQPKVTYDQLLLEVFDGAGHEIEDLIHAGILRICWPRLGSDESHELTLSPMSPRLTCAFQRVKNKDSYNHLAIKAKRDLALIELLKREQTLTSRIDVMLRVDKALGDGHHGTSKNDVYEAWKQLEASWADMDDLTDMKKTSPSPEDKSSTESPSQDEITDTTQS